MSVTNYRQRALLLAIRYPTFSSSSIFRSNILTRNIHNEGPQSDDDFSISFGPQIDDLLQNGSRRRRVASLSGTGKSRSSTKLTKKANTQLKPVDGLIAQHSSTSDTTSNLTSHDPNKLSEPTTGVPSSRSPEYSQPLDETTIELTGDAYETISVAEPQRLKAGRSTALQVKGVRTRVPLSERSYKASTTDTSKSQSTRETLSTFKPPKRETWQIQKDALRKKFGEMGWSPRKKLSPDAMDGIRGLHEQEPERYTTEILSQQFKVSPEAIRRILKAKWRPSLEKMDERRERWARRHDRIWDQNAALGLRPARLRDRAPEGPEVFEEEVKAKQLLGHM